MNSTNFTETWVGAPIGNCKGTGWLDASKPGVDKEKQAGERARVEARLGEPADLAGRTPEPLLHLSRCTSLDSTHGRFLDIQKRKCGKSASCYDRTSASRKPRGMNAPLHAKTAAFQPRLPTTDLKGARISRCWGRPPSFALLTPHVPRLTRRRALHATARVDKASPPSFGIVPFFSLSSLVRTRSLIFRSGFCRVSCSRYQLPSLRISRHLL